MKKKNAPAKRTGPAQPSITKGKRNSKFRTVCYAVNCEKPGNIHVSTRSVAFATATRSAVAATARPLTADASNVRLEATRVDTAPVKESHS
ncbi:MAG: hypothetical protein AMJ53_13400 [Gammaproteobacteria bacterium SG8_11]|nr:MAG: hypothetical protein AMJ53_13400 [Gammaproteobacteria bacterium SG8_11]